MTHAEAAERNLRFLLAEMMQYLGDPDLTDFHVNGVGEGRCFLNRGRGIEQVTLPYSWQDLDLIAINAASYSNQDVGPANPIVSTKLPGGLRCEIVCPPAVPDGSYAFSVRQPKAHTATPEELERQGVFRSTVASGAELRLGPHVTRLKELYAARRWREFLELAIRFRLRVVFAGRTGTGKTHVLRAFFHALDPSWRILTVEDTQELINLPLPNVVNLLYSNGGQSIANVDSDALVAASLRMCPTGVFHQELRNKSAYSYLQALEAGNFGLTTTHAPSAETTLERLVGLVKSHPAGMHLEDNRVRASLRQSVDVVVYCSDDASGDDPPRFIQQILYSPEEQLRAAA